MAWATLGVAIIISALVEDDSCSHVAMRDAE
jgi:hypothetical protein